MRFKVGNEVLCIRDQTNGERDQAGKIFIVVETSGTKENGDDLFLTIKDPATGKMNFVLSYRFILNTPEEIGRYMEKLFKDQ